MKQKLKILILEDDYNYRDYLLLFFTRALESFQSDSEIEIEFTTIGPKEKGEFIHGLELLRQTDEALEREEFDICILDFNVGTKGGPTNDNIYTKKQILKAHERGIPFIVFSGSDTELRIFLNENQLQDHLLEKDKLFENGVQETFNKFLKTALEYHLMKRGEGNEGKDHDEANPS
jgi:hypothetical protein